MKKILALSVFLMLSSNLCYAEEAAAPVVAKDVSITKTLEEKGVEIMNFITDTLKETKNFVIEQAPDVIRQMITYEYISILVFMCGWLLATILMIIGTTWLHNLHKRYMKEDDDYKNVHLRTSNETGTFICLCLAVGVSIIFTVITLCVTISSARELAQIKYTPKAYMIHKFIDKTPESNCGCKR